MGVTCNSGRSDCQARGLPVVLQSQTGFTSWLRTGTTPNNISDIIVKVHYEMYDGIPALRKWVSVEQPPNALGPVVTVDALTTDLLRAPNFAPNAMTVQTVQPANPTPFDQQTVPESPTIAGANGGRTQQLWFFDPLYDQCCDQETHVQYTYYTFLQVGYDDDVWYGGPTGPGKILNAGESWSSQDVRTVYHDTLDMERQGLGLRKVASLLTPQ